jgi:hypothetical protein
MPADTTDSPSPHVLKNVERRVDIVEREFGMHDQIEDTSIAGKMDNQVGILRQDLHDFGPFAEVDGDRHSLEPGAELVWSPVRADDVIPVRDQDLA